MKMALNRSSNNNNGFRPRGLLRRSFETKRYVVLVRQVCLYFSVFGYACVGAVLSQTAAASTYTSPINTNPLITQLPQVRFSDTLARQSSKPRYNAELFISNYLSAAQSDTINYAVDGETLGFIQSLSWQHDSQLRLGISLPSYYHSSGFLDQAIYDFHDVFGMPQNGRSETRQNKFAWVIDSSNTDVYSLRKESAGIGDLSISAEYMHATGTNKQGLETLFGEHSITNLRLTLPTGDRAHRAGGEAFGLSASFTTSSSFSSSKDALHALQYWWGLGITALHTTHKLNTLDPARLIAAAEFGIAYALTPSLGLKASLNTHSAYFNTHIRELGWAPVISNVSLSYHNLGHQFSFGFSEDIRPRTSPDFVLIANWSTTI